jgi:hypothetical protein
MRIIFKVIGCIVGIIPLLVPGADRGWPFSPGKCKSCGLRLPKRGRQCPTCGGERQDYYERIGKRFFIASSVIIIFFIFVKYLPDSPPTPQNDSEKVAPRADILDNSQLENSSAADPPKAIIAPSE